jgi:hypothetical protein
MVKKQAKKHGNAHGKAHWNAHGNAHAKDHATSALQASAQADLALSPEQRKYKQLVVQIDKARAELLAWQEQTLWFDQAYSQRMTPLMAELAAAQRAVALKFATLLAGPGWTPHERKVMRRTLCEVAQGLVGSEFIDEAAAAELKALHDQYAELDMDSARAASLAEMKAEFERVSGVDLGDEVFESEDALLARMHEAMQAQAEAHDGTDDPMNNTTAGPADDWDDFLGGPVRPPSPKQAAAAQRRQAKEAKEAQEAGASLREVFRKLVSALHPDRAEDDADRVRRTALMQRVNQAYDKQDLLALFALQLEIEQIDPEHLSRASKERMKHYLLVLSSQLADLQAEIDMRETAFCMDHDIDTWQPLKPKHLPALLEDEVRHLRAVVAQAQHDLQLLQTPARIKPWLKQLRRQQRLDDDDSFGMPF